MLHVPAPCSNNLQTHGCARAVRTRSFAHTAGRAPQYGNKGRDGRAWRRWLSYLLRERGAEVESFDEQAGGTFVSGWRAWPWSANVKKGSVEVLSAPGREVETLLLCWPDVCSSFAADCLTAHRGCRAVFIGEVLPPEVLNRSMRQHGQAERGVPDPCRKGAAAPRTKHSSI